MVLDADVLIRGEKGSFDLARWLATCSDDQFEVAAITVAELWHEVERATVPQTARRQQYLEAVLAPLPIIPYTEQTAREHARIWAELEAPGKMIGLLRHHRGGNSVGARQRRGDIQPKTLRSGEGVECH